MIPVIKGFLSLESRKDAEIRGHAMKAEIQMTIQRIFLTFRGNYIALITSLDEGLGTWFFLVINH